MNVNCTGSFLVSREAIKVFKRQPEGGALVFINSDDALKPSRHFLAYNSSKAAVLQMARTIANEFGPYHIRANSVLPGAVFGGSNMWTRNCALPGRRSTDLIRRCWRRNIRKTTPWCYHRPTEIAELVVFLASDRSAKMTGGALVIDGGGLAVTCDKPSCPGFRDDR